jgi:four helix bundle protein
MNHQKLKCYEVLISIAKKLPTITAKLPRGEGYIIDQLKRALSSAILNLSEGNGRISPKEKRRFFDISLASISETSSAIDILFAYNLISNQISSELQSSLRLAYAMTVGLKKSAL